MAVDINLNHGWTLTPEISTGNPMTVNDSVQKNPLGMLCRWKGNLYRYVKFTEGGVAAIANGPVYWVLLSPTTGVWTVVADQSDCLASGSVNMCAGVLGNVATDGYFVWIQVGGLALSAKITAAKAAGSKVVGGAVDLTFTALVAGTAQNSIHLTGFGTMVTASTTAATANILLTNLDW